MIKGQSKHASQLNNQVSKSPLPKRILPQVKDTQNQKTTQKNHNQQQSKNKDQKNLRITFTGFSGDKSNKQLIFLKQQAQNLGIIVSDTLTILTDLLIADSMLTSKVRFALSLNIPVIDSNWIFESTKQKQIIPYQQFYKKIFDNMKIGIIGFEQEEVEEIKEIVDAEGGLIYVELSQISKYNQQEYENKSKNYIQLAIVKEDKLEKCKLVLQKLQIYGVTQLWLYQCIDRSTFVWPVNYIINKDIEAKFSPDLQNSEFKKFKITEIQQKIKSIQSLKKYHYFQDCVIFISAQDKNVQTVMEHLVTIGSGCFINIMLPNVTHVVVEDNLTIDELQYFQSINGNIKIVNYFWLHNSFLTLKKEREEDYKVNKVIQERIQPQKASQIDPSNNEFTNSIMNNNSQSIQHQKKVQKYQQNQNLRLSRTQSLNQGSNINKSNFLSQKEEEQDLDSEIFKGQRIYIKIFESEQKNQEYIEIVKRNGGQIIKKIEPRKENVVVLSDNKTCKSWIEAYQKKYDKGMGQNNVMFVSNRWIDYCIEKKEIVKKFILDKYTHLQPIFHETPFKGFQNLKIAINYKESELIYKFVLQNYVKILGGESCSSDINKLQQKNIKLTHVICDIEDQNLNNKISNYKQHSENIFIVTPQWLLDCVSSGKKADENQYIIQN